MVVDKFRCPIQQTEGFTFNTCTECKWFQLSKGEHISVSCRKNKSKPDARAFQSAFLLNKLGMPWQVEVIKEETNHEF